MDGSVRKVIDGDTFELLSRKVIRLEGVDAPELPGRAGERAKRKLQSLIGGRMVTYVTKARDAYSRLIA